MQKGLRPWIRSEATTGELLCEPNLKFLTRKSPCEPEPKAQRNFTDLDSRVLLTKDGFIQDYNAQAAVDGAKQIIVAHGLTQSMSDCPQLVPLVDAVRANLGRKPGEISADAGYCSEDNLLALATRRIHAYVATGGPSIRPRPRVRSAAR
jgi:Transposase DDE domain